VDAAKPLTLAFSPCPNDTYIFAALANRWLDGAAPEVRVHVTDIADLNNAALKGGYELTKVSYGAVPLLLDRYRILRAGGALGRNCGPLIVRRKGGPKDLDALEGLVVAVPGERTTAFMLLRLAMQARPQTLQMRFDRIIAAVAEGVVEAGLIIHESRFVYEEAGLECIADLGEWWESQTGMPLPLGAVLISNDLGDARAKEFNAAIRESLRYAREHDRQIMAYVREHATDMREDVMRKHIKLYVNEFTEDLGAAGESAVRELFARAHAAGVIPDFPKPTFV